MREEWASVPYFPNYSISSFGNVFNHRTDRMMSPSRTLQGDLKVTLVNEKQRVTRSVRVLVAEAFVNPPDLGEDEGYPVCDTVIVLDGNKENVMADNLAWRPNWFAFKYARQFTQEYPEVYYTRRVANVTRGVYYISILQAGVKEGVLFEDILSQ